MGVRSCAQIGAEMELRAKKHDREEQSQDAESSSVLMHVANRTELKEERLRGQAVHGGRRVSSRIPGDRPQSRLGRSKRHGTEPCWVMWADKLCPARVLGLYSFNVRLVLRAFLRRFR